ncbi:inorganic phosphate transporter [Prolixibacter sp. NT017]|uniref:inorganic phosphate transporter n=1 Tax=Prolixibacter sp. NT017 TaxID=2652390 RepID=UPI00126C4A54|nr:inorganic phosphate transporter [Prolixibacter sp. NT017]GET27247.1 phosphate transporter [Prolixibacter sp. NT017]
MESFYLILVIILFALAASDLIVGVSNDAVNFLNSAIGSKAAPKWLILGVAGLGVLIGATFSSGMMEVARKGIFHPDMFAFSEIMTVFLAVMITDIILLDMFNTFGLPTSTTVSIVFELLGSAVAVAAVKIKEASGSMVELAQYINTEKALAIISGILVSVVIAFTVGTIVQWFTRLVFTFKYEKKIRYIGSMFGGFGFAVITYFIVIKGAKGASWLTPENVAYLTHNMWTILFFSFIGWTILLQILQFIFKKFDVLKFIVLVGTFALAMAFAGNDLVNFIGVPLAGFESFKAWMAAGAVNPDGFTMNILNQPVRTDTYMLLIAGLIMIGTLIASRKAKSVVATTVDLARQAEGDERFGSSYASRALVRSSIRTGDRLKRILGSRVTNWIDSRFEAVPIDDTNPDRPHFDKIRAASNLVVASVLITIGTNLKLPLSTTYVTFMVAMGTSLADRAWDRESAVYRISGVFTVVGGWFLTAFVAFTVSLIIATLISLGGQYMIFVFAAVAAIMVIRTYVFFRKREAKKLEEEDFPEATVEVEKVLDKSNQKVTNAIISTSKAYFLALESFFAQNRKQLAQIDRDVEEFNQKARKLKANISKVVQKLQKDSVETGHFYVQIVDYLREMAHSIKYVVGPLHQHVENNHKPFNEDQVEDLTKFSSQITDFLNFALHIIKESEFDQIEELIAKRQVIIDNIRDLEKNQIRRIKKKEVNSRNSVLFFNVMSETKNLLLQTVNMVKSTRDFITHSTMEQQ